MGYVIRRNLIPGPRFQHVDRLKSSGVNVAYVDHENGKRYVRAIWDGKTQDPYLNVANDISTIPGSYRLFYNVFAQGGDGKLNIYTRESNKPNSYGLAYSMPVGDGQTIRQASNQLTLNEVTIVRIIPPKTEGGMIMITECNLESASTFDAAFPYFDYATMPREAGGGVFVLAISLLMLSALNGGWRHDDRESGLGSLLQASDGIFQCVIRYLDEGRAGVLDIHAGSRFGLSAYARAAEYAEQYGAGCPVVTENRQHRMVENAIARGRLDGSGSAERRFYESANQGEYKVLQHRPVHDGGLAEGQGHVRRGRLKLPIIRVRHDATAAELDAHGLGVVA